MISLAAGAGVAGLAYALWPKSKFSAAMAVSPFDKKKYMGTWHEISRIPNMLQKNLRDVTEEYKMTESGSIQVTTRAYHTEKNKPVAITGKMKFSGLQKTGKLKVAYFLPIYMDYNILSIDDEYKYALVAGNDFDHLWVLSRDTTIPEDIKTTFLEKATALGFNVQHLKWMS